MGPATPELAELDEAGLEELELEDESTATAALAAGGAEEGAGATELVAGGGGGGAVVVVGAGGAGFLAMTNSRPSTERWALR